MKGGAKRVKKNHFLRFFVLPLVCVVLLAPQIALASETYSMNDFVPPRVHSTADRYDPEHPETCNSIKSRVKRRSSWSKATARCCSIKTAPS